jgi:hypothetical protein
LLLPLFLLEFQNTRWLFKTVTSAPVSKTAFVNRPLTLERYTAEERFDLEQGPHVSTSVVETKSETDEDRDQLKDYDIQIDRVRSATKG